MRGEAIPISEAPRKARPRARMVSAGFFSLLLLASCATAPPPVAKRDPVEEEKLLLMRHDLREQADEIDRLKAAVEALTAEMKSERLKPRPEPKRVVASVPPEKKDTLDQDNDALEPDGDSDGLETGSARIVAATPKGEADLPADRGETVADSKHELMHLYYSALELIGQQKYDQALGNLREFLSASPDHVYADRAQFQIARAHFLNKDYALVVVATNLLESRYPHSFKLPEALYDRALALGFLGQGAQAESTLRDLVKRYPRSSFADQASRKLAELSLANRRASSEAPSLMQEAD